MTKQNAQMLSNYLSSKTDTLLKAYKKPSYQKERAYYYCEMLCEKYKGKNLKICTHNTFIFTAGFIYEYNDKIYLCYITPTNEYHFRVKI